MSSFRFEGDRNKAAGRDFYENCEWNLHLHAVTGGRPSGGGEPPQEPLTLAQLIALRPEAKRDAIRKRVRKLLNRPTLVVLAAFCTAVVILLSILGGLGTHLNSPWILGVPVMFIVAGSMYWNGSLPQVRAIHEASTRANEYLEAVEMEIARQQEAERQRRKR